MNKIFPVKALLLETPFLKVVMIPGKGPQPLLGLDQFPLFLTSCKQNHLIYDLISLFAVITTLLTVWEKLLATTWNYTYPVSTVVASTNFKNIRILGGHLWEFDCILWSLHLSMSSVC